MKFWRNSSLQWQLTLSLLMATGLVWAVVIVMTWLETEHELSELLDAHLYPSGEPHPVFGLTVVDTVKA